MYVSPAKATKTSELLTSASQNRLERDIFGGSDSELSSEEEGAYQRACLSSCTYSSVDIQEERYERRRLTPPPPPAREAPESSEESADEYVQEKPAKKIRRRQEGEGRSEKKKRKRKPVLVEEEHLETLTPEQGAL